jgi:hypothetical protein
LSLIHQEKLDLSMYLHEVDQNDCILLLSFHSRGYWLNKYIEIPIRLMRRNWLKSTLPALTPNFRTWAIGLIVFFRCFGLESVFTGFLERISVAWRTMIDEGWFGMINLVCLGDVKWDNRIRLYRKKDICIWSGQNESK